MVNPKNHKHGDHIDHVVGAYGMLPVPPGEYRRPQIKLPNTLRYRFASS
jgi:hypothetical protein